MRPPTATGDLGPGHAHEYGPDGRARFTCTLCGAVDVDRLFTALEDAERSAGEVYDVWHRQQGVVMAFEYALGLDRFRLPEDDGPDPRLIKAVVAKISEHDDAVPHEVVARAAVEAVGERLKAIQAEHDERDPDDAQ